MKFIINMVGFLKLCLIKHWYSGFISRNVVYIYLCIYLYVYVYLYVYLDDFAHANLHYRWHMVCSEEIYELPQGSIKPR